MANASHFNFNISRKNYYCSPQTRRNIAKAIPQQMNRCNFSFYSTKVNYFISLSFITTTTKNVFFYVVPSPAISNIPCVFCVVNIVETYEINYYYDIQLKFNNI